MTTVYHRKVVADSEQPRTPFLKAQRAMAASTTLAPRSGQSMMDLGALNLNVPPAPQAISALSGGRDRESQLLRRIRELEEEVRVVRAENDKQVGDYSFACSS